MSKQAKNKKSFAQRAKAIMKNEADPLLQKDLLAQLMEEQEAYKNANGMNEQQQAPQQMQPQMAANGGMMKSYPWGGGLGVELSDNFNDGSINQMLQNRTYNTGIPDQFGYQPGFGGYGEQYGGLGSYNMGVGLSNQFNTTPHEQMFLNQQKAAAMKQQTPPENNGWQDAAAFGVQSMPSIASGIATYVGNKRLKEDALDEAEKARENFTTTKAYQQTANKYNLGRERASARSQANEAVASGNKQVSNAARTRGEYLAGAGSVATNAQKALGNSLSQSYQREEQMNQAEKSRVGAANAQAMAYNDQANAAREAQANALADKWTQQAYAYEQGKYGAFTGTMQDMQKIASQNQMISSLGDRYGYQRENWYTPNQRNINYTGRTQS